MRRRGIEHRKLIVSVRRGVKAKPCPMRQLFDRDYHSIDGNERVSALNAGKDSEILSARMFDHEVGRIVFDIGIEHRQGNGLAIRTHNHFRRTQLCKSYTSCIFAQRNLIPHRGIVIESKSQINLPRAPHNPRDEQRGKSQREQNPNHESSRAQAPTGERKCSSLLFARPDEE